jgi:parallel beta-helix repeat protein
MRSSLLAIGLLAVGCGPRTADPTGSVELALSNISATDLTQSSAVITWSTNVTATSTVQYGLSADYTQATPLYGLTLEHHVELTELNPGTLYHYAVTSSDATSPDMTFTTLPRVLDGGPTGDAGAPLDGGPATCPVGSLQVMPTEDLQALVTSADAGTTFCLLPGLHRDSVTVLKDGDTFTSPSGTTADGVVENGATTLAGWTQAVVRGTTYWVVPGGAPLPPNAFQPNSPMGPTDTVGDTFCVAPYLACFYAQGLTVDDTMYTQWPALSSVGDGGWYYEYDAMQTASIASEGSGYVAGDELTVSGGALGTVLVTSVSPTGAVTGLTLQAPGYNFPSSGNEATSGGSGTGCVVAITAGSGGVRDSIYLAASENPNNHRVELGTSRFLFQSDDAQDITVRGLVVEKYAAGINDGPLSVNHGGCQGCAASGWLIENNEVRLNMDVGVKLNNGLGKADQVLNNELHHNGQFGVGGGNNSVPFLVSGNDIHDNNTAHVNPGYGSGGLKFGATDGGVVVSHNLVHDNDGCGLWSDVDCQGVTYEYNTVYNESYDGIRLEISNNQTVTHNTVYGCGSAGASAQINYANSSGGTIQYNSVTAGPRAPGISVHHDAQRDHSHPGFTVPTGMNVSHNVIVLAAGDPATVLWELDAGVASWEVTGLYDENTYCVPSLPWTAASWGVRLQNAWGTFASWQDAGQDLHGQLVTGPCPAP